MVEMSVTYQGDLRCEIVHGPSGAKILTDAPVDNHGKGEAFSPTDLAGASLGACILTIMGIKARQLGVDLTGARARVGKEMSADTPRRIARLTLELHLPSSVSPEHRARLEAVVSSCPVHHSLHPDIRVEPVLHWDLVLK